MSAKDQRLTEYLGQERRYYNQSVAPLADLTERLAEEMKARVAPADQSAMWREGAFQYFTRTVDGAEYDQLCRVPVTADSAEQCDVVLDENALLGDSSYI